MVCCMAKFPFRFGLVLFVCILVFCMSNSMGDESEIEEKRKKEAFWEWQRLRDAYSIYSAVFRTSVGQYWDLFKALVNKGYTHFFPPNIDFRRAVEEDEVEVEGEEGVGEKKVKEAFAKSLGASKATVEDAAKSAANIAAQSVIKATNSLKNTLSATPSNNNCNNKKQQQNEL